MRYSRAIATRLLERLRLDVGLTGDLLEECENGRSAIWFWRQVLMAAAVRIWGDIRQHRVLIFGAVLTGLGAETLFNLLFDTFLNPWLPPLPMTSLISWITHLSMIFVTQAATGWLIARTHRAHQIPSLLMFISFALLLWVYQTFSLVRMLLINSIDQPRFRIYLLWHLTIVFVMTISVLFGGMLDARSKSRSAGERSGN